MKLAELAKLTESLHVDPSQNVVAITLREAPDLPTVKPDAGSLWPWRGLANIEVRINRYLPPGVWLKHFADGTIERVGPEAPGGS